MLSYLFPIANPATFLPFAEAGVPFVEKSGGARGWRLQRRAARALPIPAVARIARRSSPARAFLWKSRFAAAKWLICRAFDTSSVSIG
jgi:hypothetical protein